MSEGIGLDPAQVTPEQFAALVRMAEDPQIQEVIRGLGTERVLERIFTVMGERFLPEKAPGVEAVVQFLITDDDTEHPHLLEIARGRCATGRGISESPRVTIATDLESFAKLVAGKADGVELFMAGKLKLGGDMMFATRLMTFFDRPRV